MASKFDKAKGAKGIKEVAVASNTQAKVVKVEIIGVDKIFPNPNNDEDVSYTKDLEISIEKFGFTTPLEVIKKSDDTYMIVSGHRRFEAGKKVKLTSFPCIVRDLKEEDIEEYLETANFHRNEEQDPTLFIRRVRKTKNRLEKQGVTKGLKEAIGERYGLSRASVDRYLQANQLIAPIIELYRQGLVGLTHCTDTGLYTHSNEEQEEIFVIMNECLENGGKLSREVVKNIVEQYRNGKRSWLEVIQIEMDMNNVMNPPTMNFDTTPTETKEHEPSPLDRNNEVNYDYSHREGLPSGVDPLADERPNAEDYEAIEKASKNDKTKEPKPELSDEEKRELAGKKIMKNINELHELFGEFYSFSDNSACLKTIADTIVVVLNEMKSIGAEADLEEVVESHFNRIKKMINE